MIYKCYFTVDTRYGVRHLNLDPNCLKIFLGPIQVILDRKKLWRKFFRDIGVVVPALLIGEATKFVSNIPEIIVHPGTPDTRMDTAEGRSRGTKRSFLAVTGESPPRKRSVSATSSRASSTNRSRDRTKKTKELNKNQYQEQLGL